MMNCAYAENTEDGFLHVLFCDIMDTKMTVPRVSALTRVNCMLQWVLISSA